MKLRWTWCSLPTTCAWAWCLSRSANPLRRRPQNVCLFAAGNDLATVIRSWIDRAAIATAPGPSHDQQVLLSQTVGYPKAAG
jgi:hypothetical protein